VVTVSVPASQLNPYLFELGSAITGWNPGWNPVSLLSELFKVQWPIIGSAAKRKVAVENKPATSVKTERANRVKSFCLVAAKEAAR